MPDTATLNKVEPLTWPYKVGHSVAMPKIECSVYNIHAYICIYIYIALYQTSDWEYNHTAWNDSKYALRIISIIGIWTFDITYASRRRIHLLSLQLVCNFFMMEIGFAFLYQSISRSSSVFPIDYAVDFVGLYCPACRTTLVATRFRVAVICPIIQVPHCIRVFFYFVWFEFINHIFQFYHELCTYCNILDIYLS